MIDPPRRWAYLVAAGLAATATGLAVLALAVAGRRAPAEAVPGLLLVASSVPAVVLGTWLDARAVERETGVGPRRWAWALFGLVVAPLAGAAYLWARRRHFEGADGGTARGWTDWHVAQQRREAARRLRGPPPEQREAGGRPLRWKAAFALLASLLLAAYVVYRLA